MKSLNDMNYLLKRFIQFFILLIVFYVPGQIFLNTTTLSQETNYMFCNIVGLTPFIIMSFIIIIDRIKARRNRNTGI